MIKSYRTNIAWAPQAGSQTHFMSCPADEVLYAGTRGPGKTDALIMSFLQHVGKGYGAAWRGILFRQSFPQLADVIAKSKKWIKQIFPDATYNGADHVWTFADGEQLLLRFMKNKDDYWDYHGHEYPWIGWEELTNWADDGCYNIMKSCNRSSTAGLPRMYRATTNPYGVGHNWVKAYFVDAGKPGQIVVDEEGKTRVWLHGKLSENKILLAADPGYLSTLLSLTKNDPNLRKAWIEGSWDIVAGGAISDVWFPEVQKIQSFRIPGSWFINRSFDWGSSKPFSVGWWAESDGTTVMTKEGKMTYPPGTLFRIRDFYGWNGIPNEGNKMLAVEIAREVLKIEKAMGYRVYPGPADPSIFTVSNGSSIANDMGNAGVWWDEADNRPGSRINGLEKLRTYLAASKDMSLEEPGMYIFDICQHWCRTVPVLPRSSKNMEDVDTNAEDHVYDETRYRVLEPEPLVSSGEDYWK